MPMLPGEAVGRERAPERRRVERRMSLEREGISRHVSFKLKLRLENDLLAVWLWRNEIR